MHGMHEMNELDDHWHEECGIVGIYGDTKAAEKVYLGLYALQHRGQESCGIVSNNKGVLTVHKQMGLVSDVFHPEVGEIHGMTLFHPAVSKVSKLKGEDPGEML